MTDQQANGATSKFAGRAQGVLGRLTGDRKLQVQGVVDRAKGSTLSGFGRAMDALEGQIGRAPAKLQPQARKAVEAARSRPWLTMAGVAAVGFLLTRSNRRGS